jgi:hypothetical protein
LLSYCVVELPSYWVTELLSFCRVGLGWVGLGWVGVGLGWVGGWLDWLWNGFWVVGVLWRESHNMLRIS